MSPRIPLPPPPPPVELRSRPDRDARLADRASALDELGGRLPGGGRLVTFLLGFFLLRLGWGLLSVLLVSLGRPVPDPIVLLTGLFTALPGVGVLGTAVWLVVRGLRRDRTVRERLVLWAALDRHGPTDARLRAPSSASAGRCCPSRCAGSVRGWASRSRLVSAGTTDTAWSPTAWASP
ncbi:hypothetical protein [Streptomyces sp. NPDC058664]|uniref:hypothetical protein n=1 Tax=unclassified Streptomyces TaxID=2593676 RepID=UPI0036492B9B